MWLVNQLANGSWVFLVGQKPATKSSPPTWVGHYRRVRFWEEGLHGLLKRLQKTGLAHTELGQHEDEWALQGHCSEASAQCVKRTGSLLPAQESRGQLSAGWCAQAWPSAWISTDPDQVQRRALANSCGPLVLAKVATCSQFKADLNLGAMRQCADSGRCQRQMAARKPTTGEIGLKDVVKTWKCRVICSHLLEVHALEATQGEWVV